MPRKKSVKKIQIGDKVLTYGDGKQVSDMLDANELYEQQDFDGLRRKLEHDGFLFIRGVIPVDVISKARTAMLSQASKDQSIVCSDDIPMDAARMNKVGNKFCDGYCVDGITGCETNSRGGIDVAAWEDVGPSAVCRAVYNGSAVQTLWKRLFGEQSTVPLVKQTFLRLMGSSGTVQHADYYYFKRDTHIFSGDDGRNAQIAAEQYLHSHDLWQSHLYTVDEYTNTQRKTRLDDEKCDTDDDDDAERDEECLVCAICRGIYRVSELDDIRKQRVLNSKHGKTDFGMEGEWHCPVCSVAPMAIYTTWISLSTLSAPKDSILALVPESHRLREWDLPLKNAQVPGDFSWKLKWVIPKQVGLGDVIIFNIKTVHASSLNKSSPRAFRCSFDTRLQLIPRMDTAKKGRKPRSLKNSSRGQASPHPGVKLKSIFCSDDDADDEEEEEQEPGGHNEDLSSSMKSLHLKPKH